MGVFDRIERGLERAVKQPFARVFKAEVQPVEIASAMRKAMDERAAVLGPGRTMVPNVFTVELAESDHERLSSYDRALTDELVASAEDHADAQRYVAPGPFEVRLVSGEDLETGIFRVRPAAKDGRKNRGEGSSAREYAHASRELDRRRDQRDRDLRAREADDGHEQHDQQDEPRDEAGRADLDRERRPDEARDQDRYAAYRRTGHQAGEPDDRGEDGRDGGHGHGRDTGDGRGEEQRPRRERTRRAPVTLELDGRRIPLTGAVSTLGRGDECTVVLDDPGASRRHAEIRITHDGPHLQVILRDLGSTNGTYLNGEQVGSEELRRGDRITLGRSHLTVHLEG